MNEFVPGYEASTWYGIGAPKGTPAAIIERLNQEIIASVVGEKVKDRLAGMGLSPETRSAREFAKLIADEIDKWATVSKYAVAKR